MALGFPKKLIASFSNIWFLWALCLLLNIITFLLLYFKVNPGSQTLTLHYNVIGGAEWYGKGINLYFIPGSALAISIVNFILFKKLRGSEIFFAPLCMFISFCAQAIALASTIVLISVN